MKSLFEKTKQTHRAIMQKVKDALQQRDDMKVQMEEAFTAKEAVSTVMNSSVVFMRLLWKKIRLNNEVTPLLFLKKTGFIYHVIFVL